MYKLIDESGYVPGVPMRDLSDDEWAVYTKPAYRDAVSEDGKHERVKIRDALLVEGTPAAAMWEHVADVAEPQTPEPKRGRASGKDGD